MHLRAVLAIGASGNLGSREATWVRGYATRSGGCRGDQRQPPVGGARAGSRPDRGRG